MRPIAFIALAAVISTIGHAPRANAGPLIFDSPEVPVSSVRDYQSPAVPWSITGQWHYAGPAWRGMIEIREDGTFSRVNDSQGGKWKLTVAGDSLVLVLKWNHQPEERANLVSTTLFEGDTAKGEIHIRRLALVAGS